MFNCKLKIIVLQAIKVSSPISQLKSTIVKTLKIGLDKCLFKNKKSATNAEILKLVPLARRGTPTKAGPPRVVGCKLRTKLSCWLKFCACFHQLSAPDLLFLRKPVSSHSITNKKSLRNGGLF